MKNTVWIADRFCRNFLKLFCIFRVYHVALTWFEINTNFGLLRLCLESNTKASISECHLAEINQCSCIQTILQVPFQGFVVQWSTRPSCTELYYVLLCYSVVSYILFNASIRARSAGDSERKPCHHTSEISRRQRSQTQLSLSPRVVLRFSAVIFIALCCVRVCWVVLWFAILYCVCWTPSFFGLERWTCFFPL